MAAGVSGQAKSSPEPPAVIHMKPSRPKPPEVGATSSPRHGMSFAHPSYFVQSVFVLSIAQALTWIGGAATTVLFPRYLGDVNLGRLGFAWSLVALVGLVGSLGSGSFLTKEVARDRGRAPSLTASALATRLPLSVVAAGIAVAITLLTGWDVVTRVIVYVLCTQILIDSLNTVVFGTLQGYHWMKAIALSQVVSKVVYSVVVVVVVLRGGGPIQVAAAGVITAVPGLVIGVLALRQRMPLRGSIRWGTIMTVIGGGLPFFVWQASLVVYGQIDFVLLAFMTRNAVVGWYSAAYRIVAIPSFIPTILLMVVFPALSAAAINRATFDGIARRSLQVVVMLTLPIGMGILLLPDRLISFLGYPPVFWRSTAPLALLALHIPLVGIDMMIGAILNAQDKQRQWAMTGVAAAFLNPGLNLFAIPYTQARFGNGAIGAAAITTLTEIFMLVVGLVLLPRGVVDRSAVAFWGKCLLAGGLMSAVVWVARPLPLPVTVILGAGVYGVSCLALGVLALGDLRQVMTHLRISRFWSPADLEPQHIEDSVADNTAGAAISSAEKAI
jgi:O-antigen/teichoic acid export membrane protein